MLWKEEKHGECDVHLVKQGLIRTALFNFRRRLRSRRARPTKRKGERKEEKTVYSQFTFALISLKKIK